MSKKYIIILEFEGNNSWVEKVPIRTTSRNAAWNIAGQMQVERDADRVTVEEA